MLYYSIIYVNCSKMVEMTSINYVQPKTLLNNFGGRCVMSIFSSLISDFQVETITDNMKLPDVGILIDSLDRKRVTF